MGFFDVHIEKDIEASKSEAVSFLENRLTPFSINSRTENNTLIFESFKTANSLLNYKLIIELIKSKKSISLNIYGELQNVWVLVILIVTGIILTYGIGVILVILYAYYQKRVATKFINKIIEEFPPKKT